MNKKNFAVILVLAVCVISVSPIQLLAQEKACVYKEFSDYIEKFKEKCPDVAASFISLQDTIIYKEGELSIKEKEFIALGIAVSMGCENCIYYHTASAMKSGATEKEILEAASVAIYMKGGPGFTYIKHVFDALEALSAMKEKEDAEK